MWLTQDNGGQVVADAGQWGRVWLTQDEGLTVKMTAFYSAREAIMFYALIVSHLRIVFSLNDPN